MRRAQKFDMFVVRYIGDEKKQKKRNKKNVYCLQFVPSFRLDAQHRVSYKVTMMAAATIGKYTNWNGLWIVLIVRRERERKVAKKC